MQNAHSPIVVTELPSVSEEILFMWNAESPIVTTESGITTDFNSFHEKASAFSVFSEVGSVMDVNLLLLKALTPIDLTEFGIVTEVKSNRKNAVAPIAVTGVPEISDGMTTASVQSIQLVMVKVPSPLVLDSNTVSAVALDAAPTDRSKLVQTARIAVTKYLLTNDVRLLIMTKFTFP
ncbi:MAG: hypothetical protein WCK30_06475 [Actinomycetes bacterium]